MSTPTARYAELSGRLALNAWRKERSVKSADLAEILGVSLSGLNQWLVGYSRPEIVDRLAIQELTGILLAAWLTPEEEAELSEKLSRIDRVRQTKPVSVDVYQRLASAI